MNPYIAFDHTSPAATTAGNLVPSEALKRAENVLFQLMIAGDDLPVGWTLEKLKSGVAIAVDELADEYRYKIDGDALWIKGVISRTAEDLLDEVAYYYSTDSGSNWTAIKKRVYLRLSDGVTYKVYWDTI